MLDMGSFIRCWALFALPAFGMLLFPLFSSQGTWSFYLGMLTHALIYLVCLFGTWAAGVTSDQIAGIFPFSDAAGYFQDAILLTVGKDFIFNSVRRPLFSGMLAAGLIWTDMNLKLVLVFFTVIVSIAVFLFSKQVVQFFGSLVGFISLFLSFLFYRRFLGTLLTENLGLSLGMLGSALFLQSLRIEKYRVAIATYGLFVLTMALLARAGAFLILPTILLYFWQNNRKHTLSLFTQKWRSVSAGVAAIVVGFGCNFLVQQWTGSRKTGLFGNSAHSFYGMAAGYKGWSQIYIDHPDLKGIHESLFISKILAATYDLIQHQPFQLFKAVLFSFGDFFVRIFGFAKLNLLFQNTREYLIINLLLIVLLNTCLFFGLFRLWKRYTEIREAPFLLFTFIGIWLSAPFVPPIDADSMRAYAATFPFLVCITSFGMVSLFGFKLQSERIPERTCLTMLICLSAGLVLIAVLGPWCVRGRVPHAFSQLQQVCPTGEKSYVFQTHPTLAVHLVEDSSRTLKDYYPSTKLNVESFKKNLAFVDFNEYPLEPWNHVSSGNTIFMGREVTEDRVLLFMATTLEVVNKKGILSSCGDANGGGVIPVKIHSLEEISVP